MKKLFTLVLIALLSCSEKEVTNEVEYTLDLPDWAKHANMYEVNVRQYTEAGTFDAFAEHLPRLKEMGVDILWFMPIHPISKLKRKGTLGSYYAIGDYRGINPEFGDMQDFRDMVKQIHDLDMKIILDWVPNHTGWDHRWITENPDFYTKNADGEITDPINADTGESWGWTDVADLNFDNQDMRLAMIEEMKYWITEHDVDGFRCDVAHSVPDDFWAQSVPELQKQKHVFMLAEAEHDWHRNSGNFHMSYGWHFHHIMNSIAKGEKDVDEIRAYMDEQAERFNKGFHLSFTSNHDENSWNGTEFERMGEGHKAFAVLSATFEGMPLIYSGQEEPLQKRLAFFEKDNIGFGEFQYGEFYKELLSLKDNNRALWNGSHGGKAEIISDSKEVIAFVREKNGNQVVALINLTPNETSVKLGEKSLDSNLKVVLGDEKNIASSVEVTLGPWEYAVATN